jgi:large subunit ribosomal protein L29
MKAKELLDLSNDDLHLKRKELKMDNFNMRIQQQLGQLEKPHRIRENRKDIARIETLLNQRKQTAAVGAKK